LAGKVSRQLATVSIVYERREGGGEGEGEGGGGGGGGGGGARWWLLRFARRLVL